MNIVPVICYRMASSTGLARRSCRHIKWLIQQPSHACPITKRLTLFTCATRCLPAADDHNKPHDDHDPMASFIAERIGNLDELKENQVDPFRLFNVPQKFRIQTHAVQEEMRRLQRVLHPDQHMGHSVELQTKAGVLSALVNSQYRIIRDPYERAKYLLAMGTKQSLEELELELEQSSRVEPDFLERMMELSEIVESNSGQHVVQLPFIHEQVDEELQQLLSKLDEQFKLKNYNTVKDELAKLKFLSNLSTKLAGRIYNTGGGDF